MSVVEQPDKFYISSRNASLNGLILFRINWLAVAMLCLQTRISS
ncbi:hypothetical protein THOG05_260022 [Vibrio rotiferianus]|nr:hypothetical protein THOG05_260022 [Vibrio rotiferianus]CAH1551234.1 hypothetical protein THOE12_110140 [Vibrio rotiferianus]CAH1561189.1 hypothetical protein THOG10_130023 [Vibrio rotiferianus]CAH1563183.1 hypothetical protein THOB06_130023 [Vibrio rotiferianus]